MENGKRLTIVVCEIFTKVDRLVMDMILKFILLSLTVDAPLVVT